MQEEQNEKSDKEIQDKYKKLTDVEHVLERPTIYIGSTSNFSGSSQVYDSENKKIIEEPLTWVPGILTLFNELINNSYDEWIRQRQEWSRNVLTRIDVQINADENSFRVTDNGGIPIINHEEYNELLPTMLFGSLRSGSNYTEERGTVSGVNGVGASLVNVLSKKFVIDIADSKKHMTQEWNGVVDGLLTAQPPKIRDKKNWHHTSIYAQLNMDVFETKSFTDDIIKKLVMRCVEIAAAGCDNKKPLTVKVEVIKNGEVDFVEEFSFKQFWLFKEMYEDKEKFWGQDFERFKFEVGPSKTGAFESIALVNSIRTDYGTHTDTIAWHIINHIRDYLQRKHKIDVKPQQIKNQMRMYSWWLIDAPSFSTQTKEFLITEPRKFGFGIALPAKFLRSLETNEFVTNIIDEYKAKQHIAEQNELKQLNKKVVQKAKRVYIDKLVDATAKHSRHNCTLFIVEGDSAGNGFRKVRNGEIHGLFKLRGKFTNVFFRDPKHLVNNKRKTAEDSELIRLMSSLGLQFNVPAATYNEKTQKWELSEMLRYGRICIMTDADVDGYSIACQLILLFKKFWPELISSGIIYRVLTPIVIVHNKSENHRFYNLADYHEFEKNKDLSKFNIQYTKGLGRLEDDDYDEIINNPKLQKILSETDDIDWQYLYGWFGNNSDLRKILIAEDFEKFEKFFEEQQEQTN